MEVKVPGGPNPAELDGIRAQAQAAAAGPSNKSVVIGERYNPVKDRYEQREAEFPVTPFPYDKGDTAFNIKQEFVASKGYGSAEGEKAPVWTVPFTDKDAALVERKRDASEQADFDQWIARKYDLDDPGQLMFLRSIDPEYTARREELIVQKSRLGELYAKMRLRGPQSKDELRLEWMIETGRIELPKSAIWDPRGESKALGYGDEYGVLKPKEMAARYQAGYWNPLKFLTEYGWAADPKKRSDIRGDKSNPMFGIYRGGKDHEPFSTYYGPSAHGVRALADNNGVMGRTGDVRAASLFDLRNG